MSNTELTSIFVTKVRKVENLEPTDHVPRSVVGSFVPETNVVVNVNEEVPTNVDQQQEPMNNEFDAPFYNNDPIVDLNMEEEHYFGVDEVVEEPSLGLDCGPSNHVKQRERQPRNSNIITPGTSSSRQGRSQEYAPLPTISSFEVCTKFKAPMWTKEDVMENHELTTSLQSKELGEIQLGNLYNNKEELRQVVARFAINNNMEWMVKKSGTDLLYVTCKEPNCKWRLRGKKKMHSENFEVTVFHNEHTCNLNARQSDHRQAAPWVVGHLIKGKYTQDGTKYKAKDIQRDMFHDYGIQMSYLKAWRCREKALEYTRGTPEFSYMKLPAYLYMLQQKNPGTITDLYVEDERFKYCFVSLGACRKGFTFCRPVISIDGTFLKTKYGGIMLVAVAYDANNQLFPIAFGIVDSENNNSWTYFLQKLREAIGVVENLLFVSDRHQSIDHAVEIVFPEAVHCACYHHIIMNVNSKFKTDAFHKQIWNVAYSWSKMDCDRQFEKLRQMNPAIALYVESVGFEKWARPYCLGERYNIMTSNAAESFNSVTEEFRKYPITTLVEFIRFTLQSWFANRLETADICTTPLATLFEDNLAKNHENARFRRVQRNGANLYNIGRGPNDERGGDVNLVEKTCTCGVFTLLKLPCIHACAAALKTKTSVYTYCSPYYTKDAWRKTYDDTINLTGEEDDWVLPEHIKNMKVGVPVEKTPIGRPRKSNAGRRREKRFPSGDKRVSISRNCGNCGGSGHNRATCKARI